MNSITLLGNIASDIELKTTPAKGTSVIEARIAVRKSRPTAEANADFFSFTAYGKTAELIAEHVTKGDPLCIRGELKIDEWEKDGQPRSKTYVLVENFTLIGGRRRSEADEAQEAAAA